MLVLSFLKHNRLQIICVSPWSSTPVSPNAAAMVRYVMVLALRVAIGCVLDLFDNGVRSCVNGCSGFCVFEFCVAMVGVVCAFL